MTEPNQHERNDFIRESQAEAADEALRAVVGVEPIPTPDDPAEEALLQQAMARFPVLR
jgi:hypothetical protein